MPSDFHHFQRPRHHHPPHDQVDSAKRAQSEAAAKVSKLETEKKAPKLAIFSPLVGD